MTIDAGQSASVHSIFWSEPSFRTNREAGVIIRASTEQGSTILNQIQQVFNFDFNQAYPLVTGNWSESDLALITDATELPVILPEYILPAGLHITPEPSNSSVSSDNAVTLMNPGPDVAWKYLAQSLNAQSKIQISVLQVRYVWKF